MLSRESSVERREGKGPGLACLQRQLFSTHDIQTRVHYRDGTCIFWLVGVLGNLQAREREIIRIRETGKRLGTPISDGRAEVTADEPVAIQIMDGEFVDVDAPRQNDRRDK